MTLEQSLIEAVRSDRSTNPGPFGERCAFGLNPYHCTVVPNVQRHAEWNIPVSLMIVNWAMAGDSG